MMKTKHPSSIAIFASGSGTNSENLIKHFLSHDLIKVSLVLSNKTDAFVIKRVEKYGIPTEVLTLDEIKNPEKILPLLKAYKIDFIILAGFLLKIPDFLVDRYERRIINIHPSLIPKYSGKGMYGRHVHEAVKNANDSETGITIHLVNKEYDKGEIIAQFKVELSPFDTIEDIEEKVHLLEAKHFPKVVENYILNFSL